jgi:hypothetical protein
MTGNNISSELDIAGFKQLTTTNPEKHQEFSSNYQNKFSEYSDLLREYENLMQSLDSQDSNSDKTIKQAEVTLDQAEQLLIKAEQKKKELDEYYQEIKFFITYHNLPNYELKKPYIPDWDKIAKATIGTIKNSKYLTEGQRERFIKVFVTNYIKENKVDKIITACERRIIKNINNKFNELNRQELDLSQMVYQNLPAKKWVELASNIIEELPNKDYLSDKKVQQFIKEFVNNRTKDYITNPRTLVEREQITRQMLHELQNNCIMLINNRFNNKHDEELTLLIKTALDSKKDKIKKDKIKKDEVESLKLNEIKVIETAIGKQLFEELMDKYQLTTKKFTINDLRALIIGMLLSTDQEFENNHFIKNLKNLYQAETPQILREKIVSSSGEVLIQAFEKMKNSSKVNALFLSSFKKLFIPYAKKLSNLLLPQVDGFLNNTLLAFSFISQANQILQQDIDTVFTLANVNNWRKENQEELQKSASNEYIFNKLSLAELKEDITIPVVEVNGEINFYIVKKLIEQPGVNGIVLVPKDSDKSLEIKVVFQSNPNLMQEILDLENYTTMKAFNEHKLEIFNNLNKIIENFKQNISSEQLENLSLNVGGHGRGGALAQQLIHELIMSKLANNCNKQFDQTFDEQLDVVISNKCAYELANHEQFPESVSQLNIAHRYLYSRNDWYTILESIKDNPQKLEEYKEKIKKDFVDYLQNAMPETVSMHNFSLTTVNSGGVAMETRNNFIIALTMLKQLFQNIDKVNINCSKIMVDGNLMQLTGDTDLAASVDPEIMPISLIKITPKIDPRISGIEKIFEGSAKIMMYTWLLELGGVLVDIHSMLKAYNKIDPKHTLAKLAKELPDLKSKEILKQQKNILLQVLNIATESHIAAFFDKKDVESFEWSMLDNFIENSQQQDLNLDLDVELSTKLPIPLKEYYHKIQDLFTTDNLRYLQYLQRLMSYIINELISIPDALFSKETQDNLTKILSFYKILNKLNAISESFDASTYKKQVPCIFRKIDPKTESRPTAKPTPNKKP